MTKVMPRSLMSRFKKCIPLTSLVCLVSITCFSPIVLKVLTCSDHGVQQNENPFDTDASPLSSTSAPYTVISLGDYDESLVPPKPNKAPKLLQLAQTATWTFFRSTSVTEITHFDAGATNSFLPSSLNLTFDRSEGQHQIAVHRSSERSRQLSQKQDECILVIPLSGLTFGETFGSIIYPTFVALDIILRQVDKSPEKVSVLIVDGMHSEHVGNTVDLPHKEKQFCGSQKEFWPTGTKQKYLTPTNSSKLKLQLGDGSLETIDFEQILQTCHEESKPMQSWLFQRAKFVADALQPFGLKKIQIARIGSFASTKDMFILQSSLLYSWKSEAVSFPCYLPRMIRLMKTYYIGHDSTANSVKRDVITLISRPCYINHLGNCCRCKRLWVNQETILEHVKTMYPHLEVVLVDLQEATLNETIRLMDRSRIVFGVHGSAFWNVLFMYHTSALVEIWPREYFEEKYYNQPRFAQVSYVYEHAVKGNLPGHSAWTIISRVQATRLLNLSMQVVQNKERNLLHH